MALALTLIYSGFWNQTPAQEAQSDFDTKFSADGKVTIDFTPGYDYVIALALQSDGKIIAGGESAGNFALARYNADGSRDLTFDRDGKVTTDFLGSTDRMGGLFVRPDGKIIAAGTISRRNVPYQAVPNFGLAQYNSDGSLDVTFDSDGKLISDLFCSED